MSGDPDVLNLFIDLPVRAELLGRVLCALGDVDLDATVALEDTEIVVIRARLRERGR